MAWSGSDVWPPVASGGVTQVANYAALPVGADGELAQLDSGRVMRYSGTGGLWLPTEFGAPTTLHDYLDGTETPTDVGWNQVGAGTASVTDGTDVLIADADGNPTSFQRTFAVDSTDDVCVVMEATVSATSGSPHSLTFGVRLDGDLCWMGLGDALGQGCACIPVVGTVGSPLRTEFSMSAGEGPDNESRLHWYVRNRVADDLIECGTLEHGPIYGLPLSRVSGDNFNWFSADGTVGVRMFGSTTTTAKVHGLWVLS